MIFEYYSWCKAKSNAKCVCVCMMGGWIDQFWYPIVCYAFELGFYVVLVWFRARDRKAEV